MKTFKQLREETKKINQERRERIRQGVPTEFTPYLSIGHDQILAGLSKEEQQKADEIIKKVYGIHPGEAPLPLLWAAGPHIKTEPGKIVSIRPLKNPDDIHSDIFPETNRSDEEIKRGVPHNYYVGGRIDGVRKTISMAFGPIMDRIASTRFSSSSLDRIAKEIRAEFPGYSLVDQTMSETNPRVME